MKEIKRCTWCIMDDSSDDSIVFDESGRCNYCKRAVEFPPLNWSTAQKAERLDALISKMKKAGEGRDYDCVMGLSGGLDSSYLALMGHRWGLRVLAVHVDDGFDSETSKANLRGIIKATGFDYLSFEPDPEQYTALTRAYMRAGVPNIAIPQDNVLFAFLHNKAKEHKIQYFASGGNYSLESILQVGNTHDAYDLINLKDINRRYGSTKIDKLPLLSSLGRLYDRRPGGLKTVRPLDFIDYRKDVAFQELSDFSGFKYYGRKHLENRLTEFVQLYWFYHKFGVDKRTSHLSSLIVSDQLTREEALLEFGRPIYAQDDMNECIQFVRDGLGLTALELEALMTEPVKMHSSYKIQAATPWYRLATGALRQAAMLKRRFRI